MYFEAYCGNLPSFGAQMRFQRRQKLADFGGSSVAVNNQTPIRTVDRPGRDGGAQHRRYHRLDRLESSDGVLAEFAQAGQHRRFLSGLQ